MIVDEKQLEGCIGMVFALLVIPFFILLVVGSIALGVWIWRTIVG